MIEIEQVYFACDLDGIVVEREILARIEPLGHFITMCGILIIGSLDLFEINSIKEFQLTKGPLKVDNSRAITFCRINIADIVFIKTHKTFCFWVKQCTFVMHKMYDI